MLQEFVSVVIATPFWRTFTLISLIPYAMYLVAFIGEGRRPGSGPNDVPVWRDQSRAYVPGEFGLVLLVTSCLQYRGGINASWVNTWWFAGVSLGIGVAVFLGARRFLYTPNDYSVGAWSSVSKRYHDLVMFLGFTSVAVYVCLPVLIGTDWSRTVLVLLLGLFGLAVWVLGNVYDFSHNEVPNARQHPSEYRSIFS